MKRVIVVCVSIVIIMLLFLLCVLDKNILKRNNEESLTIIDSRLENVLKQYISNNYKTPERYVVSKFKNHDIIFLGEYHRIKHDVELVHNLIPLLYQAGVYSLGIEFACYEDQEKIDRLITSKTYDESLAYEIQFSQWPYWGFQEYIDIYKQAWELNNQIPEDSQKFRIVGLNAKIDFSYVKTEKDKKKPEIMKKVFKNGDGDIFMANVINKEFLKTNKKALIYCGINHAYTKYKQPIYNEDKKEIEGFCNKRMGNIIYKEIGERCMTIFLHAPWPSKNGFFNSVYPVDGVIDSLMHKIDKKYMPVGFDIIDTPFEDLNGNTSYWQYGYDEFKLGNYCDGYIYTKPLSLYEGVRVAPGFINEENRVEAIKQISDPSRRDYDRSVEDIVNLLKNDANIKKHFKKFR